MKYALSILAVVALSLGSVTQASAETTTWHHELHRSFYHLHHGAHLALRSMHHHVRHGLHKIHEHI